MKTCRMRLAFEDNRAREIAVDPLTVRHWTEAHCERGSLYSCTTLGAEISFPVREGMHVSPDLNVESETEETLPSCGNIFLIQNGNVYHYHLITHDPDSRVSFDLATVSTVFPELKRPFSRVSDRNRTVRYR